MCPFRGHFAPRLFLLRFSLFDTKSSAKIRMALKVPFSPVSVNRTSTFKFHADGWSLWRPLVAKSIFRQTILSKISIDFIKIFLIIFLKDLDRIPVETLFYEILISSKIKFRIEENWGDCRCGFRVVFGMIQIFDWIRSRNRRNFVAVDSSSQILPQNWNYKKKIFAKILSTQRWFLIFILQNLYQKKKIEISRKN